MPSELMWFFFTAVYIAPNANIKATLSELYKNISQQESSHPEAVLIVTVDFKQAHLKNIYTFQNITNMYPVPREESTCWTM